MCIRDRHYGFEISARELLISTGISGGLDLVCNMLTAPGDRVIAEETTYFSSPDIMESHGLEVIPAPLDAGGLDPMRLEELIQQHQPKFVYTIPAFHNPTGITQSLERREALLALAEKYDLYIIADEVYHLLSFSGQMPPSYSAFIATERVISLGTFSKILAPGLRVGWYHAARPVLEHLVTNATLQSAGGANPLGASLVRSVLELGLMDKYLGEIRDTFSQRAQAMAEALGAPAFSECRFTMPQGGYFIWLQLPGGMVAEQLEPRAQSFGVTVKPGNHLSVGGRTSHDHLRLCFAFNDEEQIREGIVRLGEAIASMSERSKAEHAES